MYNFMPEKIPEFLANMHTVLAKKKKVIIFKF